MGDFGCVPIRGTAAGELATKFHWATESNGIARGAYILFGAGGY